MFYLLVLVSEGCSCRKVGHQSPVRSCFSGSSLGTLPPLCTRTTIGVLLDPVKPKLPGQSWIVTCQDCKCERISFLHK